MNKVVKIVLIVIAVLAVLYGLLLAATHLTDQSYTDTRYDSDGNVIYLNTDLLLIDLLRSAWIMNLSISRVQIKL